MNEDLKPIAQEEAIQEQSATVSETVAAPAADEVKEETLTSESEPESANEEAEVDYSNKSLKELTDIFQNLLEEVDMQKLYKNAESIKAAFYKTLKREKIASGIIEPQSSAAPLEDGAESEAADENVSESPFAEVERGFKDLFAKYRVRRNAYQSELEAKKEENFKVKSQLLEELKSLIEKQDELNTAYPAFREIQNRWREAGPVPQSKIKGLYETYQHYVERFYDYVKINKELRDLDFKKNLEAKEALCEKAEALDKEEDVVAAFRTLQKLHEEWKEYGPVEKEYRDSIWERFKAATSVINKKHQAFFESQKGNQKENFEAKSALCEKVEAIADSEVADSNAWNTLSKEIENIQKEWKTIGFASKKDNQKVYERFRAACDKFYSRKRDFYAEFKNQMQDNMDKKVALCEQAEALKDSEDWKKTSDILIDLQKQWKEIGPVSRKKSEQIWKRFRAACDVFFDNRDKHFGEQDSQFAANLQAKLDLIEEVKNHVVSEARETAQDELKAFRAKWDSIGFVPFKDKAKIQAQFQDAISEKFGALADGRARRFAKKAGDALQKAERSIRSERDKLVQTFVKKEQEIATWQNNMGFFSKSKNAEALLAELNKKIDEAKAELKELENKIKEFDNQHNSEE